MAVAQRFAPSTEKFCNFAQGNQVWQKIFEPQPYEELVVDVIWTGFLV